MPSEELQPEELTALLSSLMPEIPGYRVMRRIGRGGMSHVYLGVQVSLDRQVAIKVMSPEALTDEVSKQRFEGEARTIAKLEHPCIVGIHEVGRTPQGLMYYVLPYLAKGHLGQRDFTNDEPRAIEVLKALLSALEYAHARGIVHRDVKAENVLFDNADRPLLTDFGIALSKRDTTRITTAGLALGSGGYMSPEQARGEAVDGRADLYSVGVLAHELITGRLPYLSSDPLALALMHAQDPIPRLPAEKKHWQPFIDRAMAKSPDNRFRNAQQMFSALLQMANKQPVSGHTGKGVATAAVPTEWKRPALIVGLAVVGLVLLVAAGMQWRARQADTDFYVGQPPAPTTPATTPEPAAPVVVAPPPVAANPPPAAPPQPVVEPAVVPVVVPPPDTTPVVAAGALFASVAATSSVTALDYDPAVPGAREISWARRQLAHNRLSTPAGDNAMDSLLGARKLSPADPALPALADQVIDGVGRAITDAIAAGKYKSVASNYARAQKFAKDLGRLEGKAWTGLRASLPPLLVTRLEKATRAYDTGGIEAAKKLAGVLEVPQALLEPAWTASGNLPKPGQVIAGEGPATVLVNNAGTPLAFMRQEVTRGDYARFASATRRPAAKCRNRLAPINIKKRNWSDPGFAQGDSHPVVCVSFADAAAYAQWLTQRTGESYRLPTNAEWRRIASFPTGDACRGGHIDCGDNKGTAPASQGPTSPLGLTGAHGNAREWLLDCAGGCGKHLVAGIGWRDNARGVEPTRSSGFDADTGFDDVGIRLVREVGH
ncbi:MAG: bifunctional serine/threonine-protein kinase/formylglycine-generating enzyme family protein [Arenimonas sp.]